MVKIRHLSDRWMCIGAAYLHSRYLHKKGLYPRSFGGFSGNVKTYMGMFRFCKRLLVVYLNLCRPAR